MCVSRIILSNLVSSESDHYNYNHCNRSAVSKLVLGMASIEQLHQNLSAIEEASRVPQEIWAEAKAIGLLEPHIPTP